MKLDNSESTVPLCATANRKNMDWLSAACRQATPSHVLETCGVHLRCLWVTGGVRKQKNGECGRSAPILSRWPRSPPNHHLASQSTVTNMWQRVLLDIALLVVVQVGHQRVYSQAALSAFAFPPPPNTFMLTAPLTTLNVAYISVREHTTHQCTRMEDTGY